MTIKEKKDFVSRHLLKSRSSFAVEDRLKEINPVLAELYRNSSCGLHGDNYDTHKILLINLAYKILNDNKG